MTLDIKYVKPGDGENFDGLLKLIVNGNYIDIPLVGYKLFQPGIRVQPSKPGFWSTFTSDFSVFSDIADTTYSNIVQTEVLESEYTTIEPISNGQGWYRIQAPKLYNDCLAVRFKIGPTPVDSGTAVYAPYFVEPHGTGLLTDFSGMVLTLEKPGECLELFLCRGSIWVSTPRSSSFRAVKHSVSLPGFMDDQVSEYVVVWYGTTVYFFRVSDASITSYDYSGDGALNWYDTAIAAIPNGYYGYSVGYDNGIRKDNDEGDLIAGSINIYYLDALEGTIASGNGVVTTELGAQYPTVEIEQECLGTSFSDTSMPDFPPIIRFGEEYPTEIAINGGGKSYRFTFDEALGLDDSSYYDLPSILTLKRSGLPSTWSLALVGSDLSFESSDVSSYGQVTTAESFEIIGGLGLTYSHGLVYCKDWTAPPPGFEGGWYDSFYPKVYDSITDRLILNADPEFPGGVITRLGFVPFGRVRLYNCSGYGQFYIFNRLLEFVRGSFDLRYGYIREMELDGVTVKESYESFGVPYVLEVVNEIFTTTLRINGIVCGSPVTIPAPSPFLATNQGTASIQFRIGFFESLPDSVTTWTMPTRQHDVFTRIVAELPEEPE